jgi:hypothetical protein
MTYQAFLEGKSRAIEPSGFEPVWMPDFLYGFQKMLTEWNIRAAVAGPDNDDQNILF